MVWKLKGGVGVLESLSNVSCTGIDEWKKKIKRLLMNQNTKEWEYSLLRLQCLSFIRHILNCTYIYIYIIV